MVHSVMLLNTTEGGTCWTSDVLPSLSTNFCFLKKFVCKHNLYVSIKQTLQAEAFRVKGFRVTHFWLVVFAFLRILLKKAPRSKGDPKQSSWVENDSDDTARPDPQRPITEQTLFPPLYSSTSMKETFKWKPHPPPAVSQSSAEERCGTTHPPLFQANGNGKVRRGKTCPRINSSRISEPSANVWEEFDQLSSDSQVLLVWEVDNNGLRDWRMNWATVLWCPTWPLASSWWDWRSWWSWSLSVRVIRPGTGCFPPHSSSFPPSWPWRWWWSFRDAGVTSGAGGPCPCPVLFPPWSGWSCSSWTVSISPARWQTGTDASWSWTKPLRRNGASPLKRRASLLRNSCCAHSDCLWSLRWDPEARQDSSWVFTHQ